MSRRKQTRPLRHGEEEGDAAAGEFGEGAQSAPEERISQLAANNGPQAVHGSESDHEASDRSDDLSSRESSAEQDASDISDKLTLNDSANIVKKPISEDFVNNNKENEGKQWMMNPLRVSGSLFQERMSDSEASGKESEDKTSESEEEKSSPVPEERDLNMNQQGQQLTGKNPVGELAENPLSDQL